MKKLTALMSILFLLLILSSCAPQRSSSIDMEKWQKNFKKNDQRSKYNEAARKSIFPKMK